MEDSGVESALRARLEALQAEHRALDEEIAQWALVPGDELALRRLKKRKLMLKDEIARLVDSLYPDIIA